VVAGQFRIGNPAADRCLGQIELAACGDIDPVAVLAKVRRRLVVNFAAQSALVRVAPEAG
jgi:hypothetical protein